MLDGVFYVPANNSITVADYLGGVPGWVSTTSPIPDTGGFGCQQFGFSIIAQLNLATSYTDITQLYRQYQILGITVDIQPMCGDSYNAGTGTGMVLPTITSVEDQSDAANLASYLSAAAYGNSRQELLSCEHPIKRIFKCRPAVAMYRNAATAAYAAPNDSRSTWLDCSYPDIQYYAPKFWVRGITDQAGKGYAFRVIPYLHIAARQIR